MEPLTGIGNANGQAVSGKRQSGGGTPSSLRRQLGTQPPAPSPGLRHMPNKMINRFLSKRSPEPHATSSPGRGDGDSVSDTSQNEFSIRSEGMASSYESTTSQDDALRPRANSITTARDSMLKEIRSKAPKLKLKSQMRRSGNSSQLAAPQRRERSNSIGSADNLSDKSGASGDQLVDGGSGGGGGHREHDDPMGSLSGQHPSGLGPGDETDYHERVQQQIRHYEEKLKQARQELQTLKAAYVEELSRENAAAEAQSSAGGAFGAESRKKTTFEAYNKRYKAEEMKLQEKVTKYEEKLSRLMDRSSLQDHGMMQGVKDHVYSIRRSVKSGLQQAQGGLHVPSFGKIFGSNSNINDDVPVDEQNLHQHQHLLQAQQQQQQQHQLSPLRASVADNQDWASLLSQFQETKSRTSQLEDALQQVATRLVEAGDGQEKLEDTCAKLKADIEGISAEKKTVETQLAASLERVSRLEGELSELAASFDNRVEDTLLRLQNAQLQMAERCQEIDDNVEKCEARVSELEHHDRQALPIGASDNKNTSSIVVLLINATIAVLYTVLAYWMRIRDLLPRSAGAVIPLAMLLFVSIFTAWIFR
ncbi:protein kibra-like isoform X2 [Sycon ciliatum]|uniref:protein kibra-like isoform X2 n=1 Tax=Sycon ciliatum TaxID=27933 RepID=UPI0031F6C7DE